MSARRLIALLTDFGTQDAFVGMVKAVIYGIAPDVDFIDVSHHVPPQDVLTGAFYLGTSLRWFPSGTIFLAVVDPGVGTARRPLIVQNDFHTFVAPDNGLLTWAMREPHRAFAATEPRFWLAEVSQTFHGRDIFAPLAAHLARGVSPETLGTPISDAIRLDLPRPRVEADRITGSVLVVDRFGNLITNIERSDMVGTATRVQVGAFEMPLRETFSDVPPGAYVALWGSSGHLEVALNRGDAAKMLCAGRGAAVSIQLP